MSGRYHFIRFLNALALYILSGVIIGAYIYQYTKHENPCPLCELQRLAMISASLGAIFNLCYGIHPRHYGVAIGSSIFGGAVSLRQICLHICPQFPTFGVDVMGFELYTWAFLVFCSIIIGIFILLMLYRHEDSDLKPDLHLHEKIGMALIFLVALANVVTTFLQCGFGPCSG